ncbi:hypothetical protein E8E14_002553 [Neopestalotiopsis sp. 37M]|nr:hypothetical protein E8E14_002553 [Neopestalotiopsis sp. 37M]
MTGEPTPRPLATAATFPQMAQTQNQKKRGVSGDREMPKRSELIDYNYAVAGHAGTLCDADGELFIKPCKQSEIDFYESAHAKHKDFAELMPLYYGSLSLTENTTDQMIHDAIPAIVEKADVPASIKEEVQSHLHLNERSKAPAVPELQRAATDGGDGVTWVPNKSRKITTDRAVVLHNSSFGFKKPNIMDAKLGKRLWADDAPLQKRERFNQISDETTHARYGFRVAGMRVYKGSADPTELDEEGFKIYDKYWGRKTVNEKNVCDMLKTHFIFNERAGIDEELGRLMVQAFLVDLRRVKQVLEANESVMYSSSLLFVFEGDGKALRAAMEEKTAMVLEREAAREAERQRQAEKAAQAAAAKAAREAEEAAQEAAKAARGAESEASRSEPTSVHNNVSAAGPVDNGTDMDNNGDVVFAATLSEFVGDEEGSEGSIESEDSEEFSSEPSIYSLKLIDFAHATWVPGKGPDTNVLYGVNGLIELFEQMLQ